MMGRRDSPFGDTVDPSQVTVTCDYCDEAFMTDEGTARRADQKGIDLCCDDCEQVGPPTLPPEAELDAPRVDAVHDDLGHDVGPDAEPPLEAEPPRDLDFGDIVEKDSIAVTLTRGTEELATIVVQVHDADGLYLPVTVHPTLEVLSDEAEDAIVSMLSQSTQLLIETR